MRNGMEDELGNVSRERKGADTTSLTSVTLPDISFSSQMVMIIQLIIFPLLIPTLFTL